MTTPATPIERALCCGPVCLRPDPARHGPCAAATWGASRLAALRAAGFDVVASPPPSHPPPTNPRQIYPDAPTTALGWSAEVLRWSNACDHLRTSAALREMSRCLHDEALAREEQARIADLLSRRCQALVLPPPPRPDPRDRAYRWLPHTRLACAGVWAILLGAPAASVVAFLAGWWMGPPLRRRLSRSLQTIRNA